MTSLPTSCERVSPSSLLRHDLRDNLREFWKKSLGGDEREFNRRLKISNRSSDPLSLEQLQAADQDNHFSETQKLLAVIDKLAELEFDSEAANPKQPYAVLLAPLAKHFLQPLSTLTCFNRSAIADLEQVFQQKLLQICGPTLQAMFTAYRKQTGQTHFSTCSDSIYRNFINSFIENPRSYLERYPLLPKLLNLAADRFIHNTRTLAARLERDKHELAVRFGGTANDYLALSHIEQNLSDPHNGLQTVAIITFLSGRRLCYKPRPVSSEVLYNAFLEQFNRILPTVKLRTITIYDRQQYGWCEYIPHETCTELDQLLRFARRAGCLLFASHFLCMTDCHVENVIAASEDPILCDAETILVPVAKTLDWPLSRNPVRQVFDESVIRTSLLPRWEIDAKRRMARDISGLGSIDAIGTPRLQPTWEHSNSDAMRFRLSAGTTGSELTKNRLLLHGKPVDLAIYVEEIMAGFRESYLAAMANIDLLSAFVESHSIDVSTRFIFRDTWVYWSAIQEGLLASSLQDTFKRRAILDSISQPFIEIEPPSFATEILYAELNALESLDVPYFTVLPNNTTLLNGYGDTIVADYLETTGLQLFRDRVENLSIEDLHLQLTIIHGSFHSIVGREDIHKAASETRPIESVNTYSELTDDLLIGKAKELADIVGNNAIEERNGDLQWISFNFVSECRRYQIAAMNDSLYDGICGPMLLLAAYESVTGDHQYHRLIVSGIRRLRRHFIDPPKSWERSYAKDLGIGGVLGIGSIIYSLLCIDQLLPGNREALICAVQIAQKIQDESITSDKKLDLMGGVAGLLAIFVALFNRTLDEQWLKRADTCRNHLRQKLKATGNGNLAWYGENQIPLAGYSHGAAGIAIALSRLLPYSNTTARRNIQDMIRCALAYEDSIYSDKLCNWPVLDGDQSANEIEREFVMNRVSWCHGAAGILLSRLELGRLGEFRVDDSLNRALSTTQSWNREGTDHICCGSMGKLTILRDAYRLLGLSDELESVNQSILKLISRSNQYQGYRLMQGVPPNMLHLGWFQGISGIGYELLRMVSGKNLPDIKTLSIDSSSLR